MKSHHEFFEVTICAQRYLGAWNRLENLLSIVLLCSSQLKLPVSGESFVVKNPVAISSVACQGPSVFLADLSN